MVEERGILWVVATPIGTLSDLGQRARDVLAETDVILAEDTRRTRRLLTGVGLTTGRRLSSLHEHNEEQRVARVIADLESGLNVALLSDAGTPALSDPGFRLIREARRRGLRVCSVPGPSAFTAALAASGQPPLPATLVGFLPPRGAPRRRRIGDLAALPGSLVILLSPHRLRAELEDLAEGLGGDRPATLLAEISKLHERALVASLADLAASSESAHPRGEYVVVVGPPDAAAGEEEPDAEAVRTAYAEAVAAGMDRPTALKTVARRLGLSRRQVYPLVVGSGAPSARSR